MPTQVSLSTYRQELKVRILQTAMREFKQKGIRDVRMDDIAGILGISKRTLYEIYENKEELLLAGLHEEDLAKHEKLQALSADGKNTVMDILITIYNNDLTEITNTNPLFFAGLCKYPRVVKYLTTRTEEQKKEGMAFIYRGISEGYFLPSLDYEVVLKFIRLSSKTMMDELEFHGYVADYLFKNIAALLLRGFCTQKGIKIIDSLL